MATRRLDFVYRWNHTDPTLRRLHLLFRKGQPAGPYSQFPSLIVHTFVKNGILG